MDKSFIKGAWSRWSKDLLGFLREILAIPSVTGREQEIALRVREEMERLGLEGVHLDRWGNVVGHLAGAGRGRLMLNAHLDVVAAGDETAWTHPPFGAAIDGDRLFGRGASDAKSSVACQVYAAAAIKHARIPLRSDLTLAQVVMEEVGGVGTVGLLETEPAPDVALVGVPSDGAVRIGHRGRVQVEIAFRGRAFHAGVAGSGANPHYAVARFLNRLRDLPLPEHPLFGPASIEPTLVRTDHEAANVVPETCRLTLDCRTLPGQRAHDVVSSLRDLLEASMEGALSYEIEVPTVRYVTWTGVAREMPLEMPPFCTDPDDPVVEAVRRAVETVSGRPAPVGPWLFGTDGGHLTEAGARVVGYGPGWQEGAHTADEHIALEDLREGFEGTLACVLGLDETFQRPDGP